ncbi:hypothetical protein GC209_18455 [bacterium]|nr:hypothetical protein [bacterium]
MRLALGLSPVMSAQVFTPAALFAAGEQGAWYDPSDRATLFQDNAGTTPVTAAGQSVGRVLDKSGRGNHLVQITAAQRPTYQIDATGRPYLAFDGVDDNLVTAAAIDLSAVFQTTMTVGCYRATDSFAYVFSFGANIVTLPGWALYSLTGPTRFIAQHHGATAAASVARNVGAAPNLNVLMAQSDLQAPNIYADLNNGSAGTSGAAVGGGTLGSDYFYVGRSGAGTGAFAGRIYGLIARCKISSGAKLDATRAYMNAKTGAY